MLEQNQMLQSLLQPVYDFGHHWISWAIGIGGLIAAFSWIPGVSTVLTIAVSILQMAAPVISGFLSALIWIWSNVIWPGLLDIFSHWSTLGTIVIMGGLLWFGLTSRYEVQHVRDVRALHYCQLHRTSRPQPDVNFELPWPFNW